MSLKTDIEKEDGRNPLAVGATNAVAYGGTALIATAAIGGLRKLFNKKNATNIRLFSPIGLWASAGLAAFAGIFGFIGTRRENAATEAEVNKLLSDPSLVKEAEQSIAQWKGAGSPEAKQAVADSMVSTLEGPAIAALNQAKHRDAVTVSRAAASNEIGA